MSNSQEYVYRVEGIRFKPEEHWQAKEYAQKLANKYRRSIGIYELRYVKIESCHPEEGTHGT